MGNCLYQTFRRVFCKCNRSDDRVLLLQDDHFSYTNPIYNKVEPKTHYELLKNYKTLNNFRSKKKVKKTKRKIFKRGNIFKKRKINSFSIISKKKTNYKN